MKEGRCGFEVDNTLFIISTRRVYQIHSQFAICQSTTFKVIGYTTNSQGGR